MRGVKSKTDSSKPCFKCRETHDRLCKLFNEQCNLQIKVGLLESNNSFLKLQLKLQRNESKRREEKVCV